MAGLLDQDDDQQPLLGDIPRLRIGDQGQTDQGQALAQLYQSVSDAMERQRQQSADMGLWNTGTGLPTAKGLVSAAQQYGQGLLFGTTEPGIKAYHGSPYSFDRFSTQSIGTGEGAQAYGHGLYFAENEPTAQYYRDALAPQQRDPALEAAQDKWNAAYWEHAGNPTDATAAAKDQAQAELEDAIANYKPPKGSMYEVNIGADPSHFLDWDKPLSQQSQHVQDALSAWNNRQRQLDQLPIAVAGPRQPGGARGQPVEPSGQSIYNHISSVSGNDFAAGANALQSAGIPGIKYLDQGSRGQGQGTSNYVVFNDQIIDILRKYGIAGLMLGGGASALGRGQQQ